MRRTDELKIIDNYLNKKMGLATCGREFNMTQKQVEQLLKKYNIQKRNYIEAKQSGRKYKCDDNYFKTQSPNMAYILGLLAADGCVSKKENLIAIQLEQHDKVLLEAIQQETQVNRPLEEYVRKSTGHTIVSFRVWSQAWKRDLAHYGIIPQKTFTLTPPTFLNPQYNIDYIRGFFDGDGTIYHTDSQNRTFIELVTASKPQHDWLVNELVNHYHILINKPYIERKEQAVIYKIKIGSLAEIKKLYNLFYSTESNLFMARKKEKMETLLNIPRDSNSLNEE